MVFSDLFVLYVFLPLCMVFYFLTKNIRYRNAVLIVFSIIFYAWGEMLGVFLLIGSILVNFLFGLLIDKWRGTKLAKLPVAMSLVFSLGLLCMFKYSGFIVENLNAILPVDLPVPKVTLPLGISFYTFQIISYIMDAYWGKVKVQRNFFKFMMYVSLFPQLVAGPIVRYSVVEQEIDNRVSSIEDISEGITRFIVGLAKKVILANNLYTIVEATLGSSALSDLSVTGTWYGVIVYAMYVYFDFSGYSDMAIGLGLIFGFHFNENFRYPFICRNITEFWQRWHISLGSFFRDYLLYVPIFGKRRQYLSLFLVWFSTGIWHGASWNFIIWGLYFGLFIFIERKIGNKRMRKAPSVLMHIYNKLVIIIGFGIFYFEDMGRLGTFFGNLVGANGNAFTDTVVQTSFTNNLFLVAAGILFCCPVVPKLKELIEKKQANGCAVTGTLRIISNVTMLTVCSIMLVNATNNPFLYWRF